MLKKLVKYGNSNALVLDRAILDLLNIGEGSVVKLSTDGKSLTITPEKVTDANANEVAMLTGIEKLHEYLKQKGLTEKVITHHLDWAPGTENFQRLHEKVNAIMAKYKDVFNDFDSQAFAKEVDAIAEKYHNDRSSTGYGEEVKELQARRYPKLAQMQQEIAEAAKAAGAPGDITPEKTTDTKEVAMLTGIERLSEYLRKKGLTEQVMTQYPEWAPGTENFQKLQEKVNAIMAQSKYKDAFASFDYQGFLKEVDAIAEKYHNDRTSAAFIDEVKALQAQYNPTLAQMHQEMAEAAKALGMPEDIK